MEEGRARSAHRYGQVEFQRRYAAVRGLGGVGKSVLAQQYAWESRER